MSSAVIYTYERFCILIKNMQDIFNFIILQTNTQFVKIILEGVWIKKFGELQALQYMLFTSP